MKIYIIILFTVLLTSCNKGVKLNISNNSDTKIDSLVVTNGFDKFKIQSLPQKKATEGFLNFSDNVIGDGSYGLVFYKSGIKSTYPFGYYSNGSPLCKSINISIEKDTIIFKEIL